MARVVGLDISTSIVGIAILNGKADDFTVEKLCHVDFKGCDDIWQKVDKFSSEFASLFEDREDLPIVFIEEALINFTPGFSNAQTISTLVKFNAMCAYFVRSFMSRDPNFIACTHARKLCGIKVLRTSKCGKPAKQQVFEWALEGPFKDATFEMTKTGKYKPWNYDEIDAYVIARAGLIELESVQLNNIP